MTGVVAKERTEPTVFGQNLRSKREALGWSQGQLGEKAGLPRAVVQRLETSPKANPQLDTITKLADALGCLPEDLIKAT